MNTATEVQPPAPLDPELQEIEARLAAMSPEARAATKAKVRAAWSALDEAAALAPNLRARENAVADAETHQLAVGPLWDRRTQALDDYLARAVAVADDLRSLAAAQREARAAFRGVDLPADPASLVSPSSMQEAMAAAQRGDPFDLTRPLRTLADQLPELQARAQDAAAAAVEAAKVDLAKLQQRVADLKAG